MKNKSKNHSKKSIKHITLSLWAQLLLVAMGENTRLAVGHIAD